MHQSEAAPRDTARLTFVGHATTLVEMSGTRILTDPVFRHRFRMLKRRSAMPVGSLDLHGLDAVVLSHMHFDHVGVANEVEGATLIIQKPEYDAAFAESVVTPGFEPALYSKLKDAKRVMIEGDRDVFGDGRVRIISAPGHTPGHQVLYVDLENTGPIVLSGDLYHFAVSREKRRVPSFNVDADQSLKSMKRVESLLEETGAELWIEHELAWFEQLKKSPSYYD